MFEDLEAFEAICEKRLKKDYAQYKLSAEKDRERIMPYNMFTMFCFMGTLYKFIDRLQEFIYEKGLGQHFLKSVNADIGADENIEKLLNNAGLKTERK